MRQELYKKTKTYEALYVSVSSPRLKYAVTVGNIYRPQRDNNSASNIRNFIKEIRPIVNELKNENSFTVYTGDNNLNLLKWVKTLALQNFMNS